MELKLSDYEASASLYLLSHLACSNKSSSPLKRSKGTDTRTGTVA